MSASKVFHLLVASDLRTDPRLSGRALVLFHYLLMVFATLLGLTTLSRFRTVFAIATPRTLSAVVSVLVQLLSLTSLNVWLHGASSVFPGNLAVSLESRSHVHA
ncbi:hypothetical protein SAMN05444167_1983 [Terriglobus roseus]|uniref:Uncharacterized protein n=1 Tax=Terriglobus roseus TaxID=392734 RepID=A0A1G7JXS2_9BACT|nr:hypothetical protein SAMN05444167_1983 [Terriglobus roseus]